MRLVATGRNGQVVSALRALAPRRGIELVTLGRPEIDLTHPASLAPALSAAEPDVIVSAAAYTAVDQAEAEPDLAMLVNGEAPGAIARAAQTLGVPLIHLSTDYVFDGRKGAPYDETDPVEPLNVYGRSKRLGECRVAEEAPGSVILRTSWVYGPSGRNFVTTMLRLARERDSLRVVSDQWGTPTAAADLAEGLLTVAANLLARPGDEALRGLFHLAGSGGVTWSGFAEAIFAASARHGGPAARVEPIASAEYPTAAARPRDSRLDCARMTACHGFALPRWQDSLESCIARHVAEGGDAS